MIWKDEKHGKYYVKSAYRFCVEELFDSSHLRRPGNWSGIWKLKVPPKVQNLVWRMCRGCLPTRIRLHDKGVQCPLHCVSCVSTHEDLAHLFFTCPFAIQVWRLSGLLSQIHHAISASVDAIFVLIEVFPVEQKQLFAPIL